MEPGFPPLQRTAPPQVSEMAAGAYTKPLWERSAFRTWVSSISALVIAGLSGQMTWKDAGIAAAIATVTAATTLFLGSDSVGVLKP